MKIVNLFALFQNPYNEAGWQVWRGRDLLAVFHTRAQARAYCVKITGDNSGIH